jgi:hypothetical protein
MANYLYTFRKSACAEPNIITSIYTDNPACSYSNHGKGRWRLRGAKSSNKKIQPWPEANDWIYKKNGGGGVHLIEACITYRIRLSEIQDSKNTAINTVILVELPIKKKAWVTTNLTLTLWV